MRRAARENVEPYVADHVRISRELGKPLVLEEFGISRDGGSCDPDAGHAIRDEYYARVFELVAREVADGGVLAGVNFWAWSGEGRPRSPGSDWQPGDDYTGDPPHEPQGWYGVYDRDEATLEVIRRHAAHING
jgi:mannan endo-1,4-beta-mannosidase